MAINVKECAKEGAMKNVGIIRKDSAMSKRTGGGKAKSAGSSGKRVSKY